MEIQKIKQLVVSYILLFGVLMVVSIGTVNPLLEKAYMRGYDKGKATCGLEEYNKEQYMVKYIPLNLTKFTGNDSKIDNNSYK